MKITTYFILFLFAIFTSSTYASRKSIIFGGGPTPNDSQVSIELNTQWIVYIIGKHYPINAQTILYTDGNNKAVDVRSWTAPKNELEIYHPLARVYNKQQFNGSIYTTSQITDNTLPSDAKTVTSILSSLLHNTKPDDEILLIYQGHGRRDSSNTNNNHFRLWEHTKLTVTELNKLLGRADPNSTIRFVFPQCFSGAFARLIYKNANVKDGLASEHRCGFLAQQEDKPSEGCTPSVNTKHYHDYSYYFFSAINNKTMDGEPLAQNPDLNSDGTITLREAHLYTLAYAFSVDFSFSTSEFYLENWNPWYLKWTLPPTSADNVYNDIAQKIASRFMINEKGTILATKAKKKINILNNSLRALKTENKNLKTRIKKLQNNIKLQLILHWPELEFPYTVQYRQVMLDQMDLIQQIIISHIDYPNLVEAQNQQVRIEEILQNKERELVQMKKIIRMLILSRKLAQFQLYATQKELDGYNKLIQCEESDL